MDVLAEVLNATLQENGEAELFIPKAQYAENKHIDKSGETVTVEKTEYEPVTPKNFCSALKRELRERRRSNRDSEYEWEEGIFVCDWCSTARTNDFRYVPSRCDNCQQCRLCEQLADGDCDGCEYSGFRGLTYSELALSGTQSVSDTKLDKIIENPPTTVKQRRFTVRR